MDALGKNIHRIIKGPFLCALTLLSGCSTESETDAPGLHAPEVPKPAAPAPQRNAVPSPKRQGETVTYTIVRGGSMITVANLYKLYHHEIIELNPALDPRSELKPKRQVIVYKHNGEPSSSIGLPHNGKLTGAMPMPDGPGRIITAERWKTWGTRHTILSLDKALSRWSSTYPEAPPVLVGNISARNGGALKPHKTHQSGRDVDLSYIAKWDGKRRVTWQQMGRHNLDAKRTWQLLRLLERTTNVETIFIDQSIQKLLLAHARKYRTIRSNQLARWLQVAKGPRRGGPLIKHVPGHKDHIHVRLACLKSDSRCK